MKRLTLTLAVLLVLAGCTISNQNVKEVTNDNVRFAGLNGKVTIITDNETGCKYLREFAGFGNAQVLGLTVLMKADGTADCGDNK